MEMTHDSASLKHPESPAVKFYVPGIPFPIRGLVFILAILLFATAMTLPSAAECTFADVSQAVSDGVNQKHEGVRAVKISIWLHKPNGQPTMNCCAKL
jgi:hypothetical protein